MQLDRSDRKILRELQRDAKQSNAALAASVGLSESASLRRVRLLEHAGVIERSLGHGDEARADLTRSTVQQ